MIRFTPKNKEEWLAWRKEGLGASDAAALIGMSPFEDKLSLYEKIVEGRSVFETVHMRRGKEIEQIVFPTIEARLGFKLEEQVCARHSEFPLLQCTFDGINEEKALLVEIKYVSNKAKFESLSAVPMHHQVQMQQQMLIAEMLRGLYAYTHDGVDVRMITLQADYRVQGRIVAEAARFWEEHIIPKVPPKRPKPREEALPEKTSRAFVKRCDRLKRIRPRIQKLLEEEAALKAELRQMSGESFKCGGVRFQIVPTSGRIRYKELFEELEQFPEIATILGRIDVSKYVSDPSESIRIYYSEGD